MVPPEAAALLTGLGEREIFRLIETGEIHFIEAETVFVCRDSSMNKTKLLPALAGNTEMMAEGIQLSPRRNKNENA